MLKYISMHIKSQLEYKVSFIFLCISQLLTFSIYYVTFYSLFEKFGMVKSFSMYQVMICFAVVQFGQSLAETLFRGFDKFSELIKHGGFDLLLVRPQNIFLQVTGTKIEISKSVKVLASLGFVIWAAIKLDLGIKSISFIIIMLIGSTIVFASIIIIGAAFCFVTTEGLEIVNIFLYGTRDFAQYPIGIFNKTIQIFFTYLIPISLTSYYPMLYLTGISSNIWYCFLPLLTVISLVIAIIIFNFGIKKYKSSGS